MRKVIIAATCLLFASVVNSKHIPDNYAGADAGRIVIGIGSTPGTFYDDYTFLYRVKTPLQDKRKPDKGSVRFMQRGFFGVQKPDYTSGTESGVVIMQSLPPGEYEIYNFDIFENHGMNQTNFSSRVDFSIVFTVRPGETTYLGNYLAKGLMGKNIIGLPLSAGAVFAVSDRHESDIAIAERKGSLKFEIVTNATPDPAKIGNPYFAGAQ